jgi:hypothetical protein
MTRSHFVKKSAKEVKLDSGEVLPKGSQYYWWKFNFGSMHKSKTAPTASQLTNSPYEQELISIQEDIEALTTEDIGNLEEITGRIESLRDDCQDKLDNMPEGLQESSSSGQLLQERIDSLEAWSSDLENIDTEVDEQTVRDEVTEEQTEQVESEVREAELNPDIPDAEVQKRVAAKMLELKAELESDIQEKLDDAKRAVLDEIQQTGPG